MTEGDKFMARLSEARNGGLVDMKFFFRPCRPMTSEEIFGAMNELDEAISRSDRHAEWKGNEAAGSAPVSNQ